MFARGYDGHITIPKLLYGCWQGSSQHNGKWRLKLQLCEMPHVCQWSEVLRVKCRFWLLLIMRSGFLCDMRLARNFSWNNTHNESADRWRFIKGVVWTGSYPLDEFSVFKNRLNRTNLYICCRNTEACTLSVTQGFNFGFQLAFHVENLIINRVLKKSASFDISLIYHSFIGNPSAYANKFRLQLESFSNIHCQCKLSHPIMTGEDIDIW